MITSPVLSLHIEGDSGAVVVDGLLTGGSGATASTDIMYVRYANRFFAEEH